MFAEDVLTIAGAANGSQVQILQRTVNSEIFSIKNIYNAPSGRYVFVDYFTETTGTLRLSGNLFSGPGTLAGSCTEQAGQHGMIGFESGADKSLPTILGKPVIKLTANLQVDNGPGLVRHEKWVAPSLGCYPLRMLVWSRSSDGAGRMYSQHEVVSFAFGEPDAGLFEIPSGFTERPPSGMMAEFHRRKGDTASASCDLALVQMDKRYRELRHPLFAEE